MWDIVRKEEREGDVVGSLEEDGGGDLEVDKDCARD